MSLLRKIAIFLSISIVLLGLAIFAITQSNLEEKIRNYQSTKTSEVQTLTVVETARAINLTSIANSPISTDTATIPPPSCNATIVGGERVAYTQPSRGTSISGFILPNNSQVTIYAKLGDPGWWQINYQGQVGWVRNDFIQRDNNCESLPTRGLFSLLTIPTGYKPVIDDTFSGTHNPWVSQSNNPITVFFPDAFGDYNLKIRAVSKSPSSARLLYETPIDIGNFETQMSYLPTYYNNNGYVGLRYHINRLNNSYLEFRTFFDCQTGIYKIDGSTETTIAIYPPAIPSEESSCHNSTEDYLRIAVGNNTLSGQINNLDIPSTLAIDPSGEYATGDLELIAYNVIVDFYFLLVTAP